MPEENAFASSALSQQHEGFTLGDVEIHSLEDLLTRKGLTQISNLDQVSGRKGREG